jgi:hypothetical protein
VVDYNEFFICTKTAAFRCVVVALALLNNTPVYGVQTAGSITLFEGSDGHLVPIHNYDLVSGGFFVLTGKMILHSILNRCTGITGLSPAVLVYLITGSRDAAVEHIIVEDVPDPVYQELLYKVSCTVIRFRCINIYIFKKLINNS